jgi:hypothetical protein
VRLKVNRYQERLAIRRLRVGAAVLDFATYFSSLFGRVAPQLSFEMSRLAISNNSGEVRE